MTAAGEETFAHGPVKVPVEDLEPIKIFRGRISEQQRFWEDLAKERAENANLPQRRWSIQCNDQLALETRRERFEQLAEHAVSVSGRSHRRNMEA